MTPEAPEHGVESSLSEIWHRTRPLLLARVATVERATLETAAKDQIEAARTEAHRLAGILGTFGLHRGTELARELEHRLDEPDTREATGTRRLVAELRRTVERGQP